MSTSYEDRIIAAAIRLYEAEERDDEEEGERAVVEMMAAVRGLRARRPPDASNRNGHDNGHDNDEDGESRVVYDVFFDPPKKRRGPDDDGDEQ